MLANQLYVDNVLFWCHIATHSSMSVTVTDVFQKYYHGESIAVNVLVDNNTNKTVKKIKISGSMLSLISS